MTVTPRSFADKAVRNKEGKLDLVQLPNLPLAVWFVTTIVSKIAKTGSVHEVMHAMAFGALFTWAWLEIFQGVNYFRRALGLLVMIYLLTSRL